MAYWESESSTAAVTGGPHSGKIDVYSLSTEQAMLESGKSPELISVFKLVEETGVDGVPKFSPCVCRDLARTITCRTYAPAVLEFCHLVVVANACGGGRNRFEDFFWGSGPARTSGFQSYISRNLAALGEGEVSATDTGVEIVYADGGFTVNYSRMPFLSALMEFLISTVGYPVLEGLSRSVAEEGATAAAVSRCANELSRHVYDYLKDHLPTAQNHRKFHRLITFLEEWLGGDFEASSVDDETVLEFWKRESPNTADDGADCKTFLSVFRAFVRFCQALERVADLGALANPVAIGMDREAGEVDPDSVLGLVETVDEARNPLMALREPPAGAIKFLNKQETAALELLVECGRTAFELPLSLMRCEVFGKGQARITQALRRKLTADGLGAFIDDCVSGDYLLCKESFEGLSEHIERTLLASLYALIRSRDSEAITLLMVLQPNLDLEPLAEVLSVGDGGADNVVALGGAVVAERFMSVIGDADKVGPEISALVEEAGRAFKGLSRQGFGEEEVAAEPNIARGFAEGARALLEIDGQVTAFCGELSRVVLPQGDWDGQFEADSGTFRTQFQLLYGGVR